MKVSNSQNNISFKSNRLCSLNLECVGKKGEKIIKKAFFSRLNPVKDSVDAVALREIDKKWEDNLVKLDYMQEAMDSSNSGVEFFCLELDGGEKLSDRIVGIASTSKFKDKLELLQLETRQDLHAENGLNRSIKNVGKNIFGCVLNEAKKAKASCVEFCSVCDGFYKKIAQEAGISLVKNKEAFEVKGSEFDKYLKHCEDTSGAKFSL